MANQDVSIDSLDFLPDVLKRSLQREGITALREFQFKGIKTGLKRKNLVIVAPTGSGKTLIGEILAIINIIHGRKALFLVPYKALAEEVKNTLSTRYPFIKIGISTGDYREKSVKRIGLENDLIILTYEKADLLRREMPKWMNMVEIIIIDEMHLIGDINRGSLLDSVITAFKMLNYQIVALSATIPNGEEIADWLGAELITSNYRPVKLREGVYLPEDAGIYFYDPLPEEIEYIIVNSTHSASSHDDKVSLHDQRSLDDFVTREKKKIETQIHEILGEQIKVENIRYTRTIQIKREIIHNRMTNKIKQIMSERSINGDVVFEPIIKPPVKIKSKIGFILDLVYDLLKRSIRYQTNWQILVFRRSRKLAQTTAKQIARFLNKLNLVQVHREHARSVAEELLKINEITPLTEELAELVKSGVAFHHAGLTYEERKIIEEAFRQRKISVIVATPTLGAGINIPARRVIIETLYYDPVFGYQRISVAQYKQRAGRAGRPGLDTVGEAVLIARNSENLIDLFSTYIFGSLELIRSKLGHNLPAIRQQLLALVASHADALKLDDILHFFRNTFFYWQCEKYGDYYSASTLEENIKRSINKLAEWGFISKKITGYVATRLGRKISSLYIDPSSAQLILGALRELTERDNISKNKLILALLLAISRTQDISNFAKRLLTNITKLSQFILELPPDIFELIKESTNSHLIESIKMLSKERYYEVSANDEEEIAMIGITSMLLLWINGYPIQEILRIFSPNFGAGDFRELIRLFEWLLYCTREIAKVIKMPPIIIKQIEILRLRVYHGVTEDLLEIVRIPGVGRVRANILMQHGFRTLKDLSKANITQLKRIPGIGEKIAERIINYVKKVR